MEWAVEWRTISPRVNCASFDDSVDANVATDVSVTAGHRPLWGTMKRTGNYFTDQIKWVSCKLYPIAALLTLLVVVSPLPRTTELCTACEFTIASEPGWLQIGNSIPISRRSDSQALLRGTHDGHPHNLLLLSYTIHANRLFHKMPRQKICPRLICREVVLRYLLVSLLLSKATIIESRNINRASLHWYRKERRGAAQEDHD